MKKTFLFILMLGFYIGCGEFVYAQDFIKAYCVDQENDINFEQRCKKSEMDLLIERNKKIMELENNSFPEDEYNIMYFDIMNSYSTIINTCNVVKQSERVKCLSIENQENHRDTDFEENDFFVPTYTSDEISAMRGDLINSQSEKQPNSEDVIFEDENLKNSYYKEMIVLHHQIFSVEERGKNIHSLSDNLSFKDDEQNAKSNVSPERSNDHKDNKRTSGLPKILVVGCFILAIISCPILIFIGVTNQAVVFYNAKDLAWSFLPVPASLIAFYVAPSLQLSWGLIFIRIIVTICFLWITVLGFRKSIGNAIFYNRSTTIGIAIGLMKPFVIAAALCGIIGKFDKFSSPNSTRAERTNALLVFAFWTWVGRSLINGKAVYMQKGWSEPSSKENAP